ncbi:MAG: hypothetical protein GY882_04020, partial [Actinomycetia bacterium]|nr:hypothetical protein [Actinomycetes bacterium]
KAKVNRFWPSLGNHDWYTNSVEPHTDYFDLPGNERYYVIELAEGIEFFAIDSDAHEPDGITPDSPQAMWLRDALAKSTATWKIVGFHHPSFSSGIHGDTVELQWPFGEWGADLVVQGHDHTYERMIRDGVPYIIDGRGGRSLYYVGTPVAGSRVQYNGSYGASILDFDGDWMHVQALNIDGGLVDEWKIHVDGGQLEGSLGGSGPWSYLDDDQDEESGWYELEFDADAWDTGTAPFGYGLPGLRTEIEFAEETVDDTGDTAAAVTTRAVTSYFRHEFQLLDADAYAFSELQLACDDGCIAYLNGTEIARVNMPSGTVDEETVASSSIYTDARTRFGLPVDPDLLIEGTNVLAVEVHQADTASADAWMDA